MTVTTVTNQYQYQHTNPKARTKQVKRFDHMAFPATIGECAFLHMPSGTTVRTSRILDIYESKGRVRIETENTIYRNW